jgi:uncharacterized protein
MFLDNRFTAAILSRGLAEAGSIDVFIEVADLDEEPLHVHKRYETGELGFRHEHAALEAPVAVDFVLTHDKSDLRLAGNLDTAVRFTCGRCLRQMSRPVVTRFDLLYLPQPPATAGPEEEIELKYEDMDVGFYDGIRLDVDLMAIEQIELALPMRFICGEECRGLCPMCGADLNERTCSCSQESSDPRLAVLREFRRKKVEP